MYKQPQIHICQSFPPGRVIRAFYRYLISTFFLHLLFDLALLMPKRMLGSLYNYVFGARTASRHFATNNLPLAELTTSLFHPRLAAILHQLDAIAPRFSVKGSNIDVLTAPDVFYATLKLKIASAKKRVFLSSLYVGKTQHELIECLAAALEANDDLRVYILTDALRGTREAPATCLALLLVPLVEQFGPRVDIRMYHTPHLSGFKKNWAPKRINEGFGLQHMKLYGFDDEIMLSGANLSEDYFTDRQDRYYVFSDRHLTDYYFGIHTAILSLSYRLQTAKTAQFRLSWPTSNKLCEPDLNLQRFLADLAFLLEPLLTQGLVSTLEPQNDHDDSDTFVYPVSQFSPLLHPHNDVSTEKPAVLRILSYLDSPKIRWWFTAGYFNMLPQIQERLMDGLAEGTVITASAKANSFYKLPGVSYYIPEAYLLIAKKFLEQLKHRGKDQLISLYEWQNGVVNTPGGWSYHAKGLWVTVPDEDVPSVSVIGLSNFTKRAYSLDLESNAIVVTKDEDLKRRMRAEIDNLMVHAHKLHLDDFKPRLQEAEAQTDAEGKLVQPLYAVDEDRRISYGVHLALKFFGGKL